MTRPQRPARYLVMLAWLLLSTPADVLAVDDDDASPEARAEESQRLVQELGQGVRLEEGDILVARAVDVSCLPLFLLARGVALEVGGQLSHTAIVAREFGIPMVTGVGEVLDRGGWGAVGGGQNAQNCNTMLSAGDYHIPQSIGDLYAGRPPPGHRWPGSAPCPASRRL